MQTLTEWLNWQESLHLSEIDLGLDRIRQVATRLDLLTPHFKIITVAGTNGKGSCTSFLNAMLSAQGYTTGVYTSPHFIQYNERIQIAGKMASDHAICTAFQAINDARNEVSLTYFEFATLAALWLFVEQKIDIAILEVGLGGRLDAVNLWDADLALITTIALDHQEWLGNDRESIGREKAGIMRPSTPVIFGDKDMPASITNTALEKQATLYSLNKDYTFNLQTDSWSWKNKDKQIATLPFPSLQGYFQIQNAALVIAGLHYFPFPVTDKAICKGLAEAMLPGRLQLVKKSPDILLDVAHNPQAVSMLADFFIKNKIKGKTRAIFSILADKDFESVIEIINPLIDEWHVIELNSHRALGLNELKQAFKKKNIQNVYSHDGLGQAMRTVNKHSQPHDRLVIFGSFLIVSDAISFFSG